MTPYYEDELVTLYHGDCRELLGGVGAGVVVTDPPYGIGWDQHGGGRSGKSRGMRRIGPIVGDENAALRDEVLSRLADLPGVVFGSFRAPFPDNVAQVLIHQKTPDAGLVGSTTGFRRDVEPIFLVGDWPRRDAHSSAIIVSRIGLQRLAKPGYHPHVKPLDVLRVLIDAAPPGVVLDPFAGSGSTLVAAKSLGRQSIGIEIEERYCEVAANRCRQEVLGLTG